MNLQPEEPFFGPWQLQPLADFTAALLQPPSERKIIVVDGRSAGGKTTLADKLASALPDAVVVHTDDIAWHHSMFDWMDLALEHVLKPARAAQEVSYRPKAWLEHNRKGSIQVPPCQYLILEGVGSARRELMHVVDFCVWVQSDFKNAEARGIERDGGDERAFSFWHHWMAAELAFQKEQRPWERADAVVCGTPSVHDPAPASHIVTGQVRVKGDSGLEPSSSNPK